MPLRALSDRILNRLMPGEVPSGVSRILAFSPANESGCDPHPLAHDHWELWLARDFARGYCAAGNDPLVADGGSGMAEEDLRAFAEGELGHPVMLAYFGYPVAVDWPSGSEVITVPAYYVTPA
jgi:hypothetical protein